MKTRWFTCLCLSICLGSPIQGQTQGQHGRIVGSVVDRDTQQPLVSASIQVLDTRHGGITNEAGAYVIGDVAPGVYRIRVTYVGYQAGLETDVRVTRAKTVQVRDIQLRRAVIETAEMVVTSGYFADAPDAPTSTWRSTREEIRRAPGAAGDVFRAIDGLPGVSSSGGEFSSYYVRGAGPRDNLILVDNIPFEKVAHFDGGALDDGAAQGGRFSVFAPGLIDEARFQAGGFPARYGGKRASYLDLRLREGNRVSPSFDARYDLFGWELNYDGPAYLVANTGLLISARREDLGRVLRLIDEEEEGAPQYGDLILKSTTDISDRTSLSTLLIYAPEKMRRTSAHVRATKQLATLEDLLLDNEEARFLVGATWRQLTGEDGFLESTLYFRHNDRDWRLGRANPGFTEQGLTRIDDWLDRPRILHEDQRESEWGLKSAWTRTAGEHTQFTAGFEARRLGLDFDLTLNGVDTLYTFDASDLRADPDQHFILLHPDQMNASFHRATWLAAGFLEASTMAGPVRLNPGLRLEYDELSSDARLAPRLSASIGLHSQTRLNLATGIYYQAPHLAERTAAPANAQLADERAVHAIAGVTHNLRNDIRLAVEAYYKHFDQLVVQPDRASPVRTNQGEGWAGGIDVGVIKRLTRRGYAQVSYAFGVSRRNDHDTSGSYDADFSQPHVFSIVGGYEANARWSFSTKWRYATGRPTDRFVVHEDVHAGVGPYRYGQQITAANADRLPDYHSLNLRIDYRRELGGLAVIGFLDVLNAYGRLNPNYRLFLPRTGTVKSKGIEMVPSFGLRIQL
ncbi:MAG: TonB-dependent receptor [Gemmatimonadetes bacterium]|nr:TonB-dependent receptor [Gemmatimonadota bacterium]MBT6144284.1 TonB-dependent receptor [Gemmatimonadota bacterium]MBT7859367.1 TonB-dependent receptor [Gemmatimonadota bacterium]